nr:YidB family protein [uncultured Pseudogulbenkiania sp.]
MSLFDQVTGLLGGESGGGLLGVARGLLEQNGGVAGLVEKFQQGGLGDVVSSWVGSGANLTVSPEQIQAVLGNEQLAGLAQSLGIDTAQLSQQLAEQLPQLVDKLTPGGELPSGELAEQGLKALSGLFGRG